MSSLGPWIGGVEVKLEIGICRVKKTYRLIRLTSVSPLMSMWEGKVSSMMIIRVRS
jgi:hypothetical protein